MSDRDDGLLALLLQIETKPALYLGCEDLSALRHLVTGYVMAKQEQGIDVGEWLGRDFRLWLAGRYGDSRSLDWCGLILCNEALYIDPRRAFSRFYELLHLYLEENDGTG